MNYLTKSNNTIFNGITIPKAGVVILICCLYLCSGAQILVIDCEKNILSEKYLAVSTNPFKRMLKGENLSFRLDTLLEDGICINGKYENSDLFYSISLSNRYLSNSFRKSTEDSIVIPCKDIEHARLFVNLAKQISYEYYKRYKNKWYWMWPTYNYVSERKLLKALKDKSYFKSYIKIEGLNSSEEQLYPKLLQFEKIMLLSYLLDKLSYDHILKYVYHNDAIDSIDWISHLEYSRGNFNRTEYQLYFIRQVTKKDFNSTLHQFLEQTHSLEGNTKHIHHYLVISTLFRLDYELSIFTNRNWEQYNIDYDYIISYLHGFKDDPRTEWLIRYLKTRNLDYNLNVLVTDLSQKAINLSEIVEACDDEYIIFDFWATWCKPCIKSFPDLESFAKENSLSVLAISGDEDRRRFENWVSKNGADYSCTFLLSEKEGANPVKSFEIKAYPSYFIYNKSDRQFFGPLHSVDQVKALLKDKL